MSCTAKNSKCFLLSIPALEKYIPLARRYIVEVLMAYGLGSGFLYQMEIVIDELCGKISNMIKKQTTGSWLDIKFEIGGDGLLFDILEQNSSENNVICTEEGGILQEFGIGSPEICLIERYSDSAILRLRGGRITNVKITRAVKVD
ncbi:MAG: ATP-binding protein [Chitinispirillales bacterium]|jgi:hypothetical protein|nr:ATP-binding protein [Chitinispirillales bacterium]